MDFVDRVCKTIIENNMPTAEKIVVGFSGGADSAALLKALWIIKNEGRLKPFDLAAAHINHGLRGEESDRDERFARDFCRENGIEIFVLKADVRAEMAKTGENEEECGRRIRYEFFDSVAGQNAVIATAHTLSDSVETVLMNFARGCTLSGLCGIPPVNGRVIRPLIGLTRGDTENFCREQGIDFVTDSTNLENIHRRNIIRHSVVPVLKELNPSIEDSCGRMIEQNRRENELLERLCDSAADSAKTSEGYNVDIIRTNPPAIVFRLVRKVCFEQTGIRPEYRHVNEICSLIFSDSSGRINLLNDRFAEIKNRRLIFGTNKKTPVKVPEAVTFSVPGRVKFGKYEIIIKEKEKSEIKPCEKIHTLLSYSLLDRDKIDKELTVRARRDADKIRPNGRGVTKPLRRIWSEKKIPLETRSVLPVICDSNGIIFAAFAGCDERAAAKPDSKNVILIEIRHE